MHVSGGLSPRRPAVGHPRATAVPRYTSLMSNDFLAEIVDERARRDPNFARLVAEAQYAASSPESS